MKETERSYVFRRQNLQSGLLLLLLILYRSYVPVAGSVKAINPNPMRATSPDTSAMIQKKQSGVIQHRACV